MTMGTMFLILIGCLILAVIAWLVTGNLLIGLLFPILLIAFLLMWKSLKKDMPTEQKEEKAKIPQQAVSYEVPTEETQLQPPVSTNYPPTQQ